MATVSALRASLACVALAASGCYFAEPDPPGTNNPPGPGNTRLAAGAHHACWIDGTAHLWCWGKNTNLQIQKTGDLYVARPVDLGGSWVSVAAGTAHTCALDTAGAVSCWGSNAVGQLGSGALVDADVTKVTLPNGVAAVKLFAGGDASCAITADRQLYCWGNVDRAGGQPYLAPAQIQPTSIDSPWRSIALGPTHACANTDDSGDVYCWGDNDREQLGVDDSGPVALRNAMRPLESQGNVGAVAVGTRGTCILTNDTSRLACWGIGTFTGGIDAKYAVVDDTRVWQVLALGDEHACVIADNGDLSCWGADLNGALGGTFDGRPLPAGQQLGNARDVVTGMGFTCAATSTGDVECWGSSQYGELGNGEIATERSAYKVDLPSGNVFAITAGYGHSCASMVNRDVLCWGDNRYSQVQASANKFLTGAVQVKTGIDLLAAGSNHTCGRQVGTHAIDCWGDGSKMQATQPGTGWDTLAAGNNATCGVMGGIAKCWGDVPGGQTPTASVTIGSSMARIAVGEFGALVEAPSAYSVSEWGIECQIPSAMQPLAPTSPLTLPWFSADSDTDKPQVSVSQGGEGHGCVWGQPHATSALDITCWGQNTFHQVSGAAAAPCPIQAVATPPPGGWAAPAADPEQGEVLAVSGNHSCALSAMHNAWCWGDNSDASLGELVTAPIAIAPTQANTGTWKKIATGPHHTCAIAMAGDSVWCWGLNRYGEVGNGKRFHEDPVRAMVSP
jgi:alpha-tubulin suppressor-like RCC1 family protein